MVTTECARQKKLEKWSKIPVWELWAIHHTARIWHKVIFISFAPSMNTSQDIFSPAMKTSTVLPSNSSCNKDVYSVRPGWTKVVERCDKAGDTLSSRHVTFYVLFSTPSLFLPMRWLSYVDLYNLVTWCHMKRSIGTLFQ
jgi:hypothetical protein